MLNLIVVFLSKLLLIQIWIKSDVLMSSLMLGPPAVTLSSMDEQCIKAHWASVILDRVTWPKQALFTPSYTLGMGLSVCRKDNLLSLIFWNRSLN